MINKLSISKLIRIIAVFMAVILSLTAVSCGKKEPEQTSDASQTAVSSPEPSAPSVSEPDESQPAQTAADPYASGSEKDVRIAAGSISGKASPLFSGDEISGKVMRLTQEPLLRTDSTGAPDWENSIAEFEFVKNDSASSSGSTVCRVTLKDSVGFSDASSVTADDIIFTYYVAADSSYHGPYRDAVKCIRGLNEYRVNNTGAGDKEVTDELVRSSLDTDPDVLQAISREVVRPLFETEKIWCEQNWQSYADRGFGRSAEELFINLYIKVISVDYDPSGKDFDRIVEDAVKLYGGDYKTLGVYYRGDASFFEKEAIAVARTTLEDKIYGPAEGHQVDRIEGLTRIDDRTVEFTFDTDKAAVIRAAFSLPVQSRRHSGGEYNYNVNLFGVTRDDVENIHIGSYDAFGAGRYVVSGYEDIDKTDKETSVSLKRNERYYQSPQSSPEKLTLVSGSGLEALKDRNADAAVITYEEASDKAAYDAAVSEPGIRKASFGTGYCTYVGINASKVRVGNDTDSEASRALRAALLTALSANRQYFIDYYDLNDFACVRDSLSSAGSWLDIPVVPAFERAEDGSSLYSDDMEFDEWQQAATEAVKELLKKAGYKYSQASGKFTSAPEGAQMSYTLVLDPTVAFNQAAWAMAKQATGILETMGLKFEFERPGDLSGFIDLIDGSHQLWISSVQLSEFADADFYSSSANGVLFGHRDSRLEKLCGALRTETVPKDAAAIFAEITKSFSDDALLLPLYEKQDVAVARTDRNFSFTRWSEMADIPGLKGQG